MEDKKTWIKLVPRKNGKTWKIDVYFGIAGDETRRGHETVSGAVILDGKLVGGETYYLRDINGNVLINKDEDRKNLL